MALRMVVTTAKMNKIGPYRRAKYSLYWSILVLRGSMPVFNVLQVSQESRDIRPIETGRYHPQIFSLCDFG
jgi:hypothetical protein